MTHEFYFLTLVYQHLFASLSSKCKKERVLTLSEYTSLSQRNNTAQMSPSVKQPLTSQTHSTRDQIRYPSQEFSKMCWASSNKLELMGFLFQHQDNSSKSARVEVFHQGNQTKISPPLSHPRPLIIYQLSATNIPRKSPH